MAKNYNSDQAKIYIICSDLCSEQFEKGLKDKNYDGDITVLPSYKKLPRGYIQVAALKSPDLDFSLTSPIANIVLGKPGKIDLSLFKDLPKTKTPEHLETLTRKITQNIKGINFKDVYQGFVLQGTKVLNGHVVSLRGTKTLQEWIMNALAIQIPILPFWSQELSKNTKLQAKLSSAKVHLGFLIQYALMAKQVFDGVEKAKNNSGKGLPLNVTGYSRGGGLAVLVSLATFITNALPVQMLTFAGPRVGDPNFKWIFDLLINKAIRVVNMADIVPVLPPESIEIAGQTFEYAHVGKEASFLWQTGDLINNHLEYDNAVKLNVPTITPPMPNKPVTGRP